MIATGSYYKQHVRLHSTVRGVRFDIAETKPIHTGVSSYTGILDSTLYTIYSYRYIYYYIKSYEIHIKAEFTAGTLVPGTT